MERTVVELRATGSYKAFEKEYFRKDGSRVPVLLGGATFNERRDQGVSFVLDLTERKRAEEELRESERRYREAQIALAHANRVTTMGQLAASISHEVNQPLVRTGCSMPSSPPNPAAWAWDSRSAVRSWKAMVAGFGPRQTYPTAPRFSSPCR